MNVEADCQDALAEEFRTAFRGVASTVVILSAALDDQAFGMVATAVMPVTLTPPTLVVGVNRSASIHSAITGSKAFCVNVLGTKHEDVSRHFASSQREERFLLGRWTELRQAGISCVPYLDDAQAAIFCKLQRTIECGSHSLILGAVERQIVSGEIDPLLYCDGRYGTLRREGRLADNVF